MNVHDLNRDQLIELKQAMLFAKADEPSWGDLAAADELISDSEVFEYHEGVVFSPDDFSSSAGNGRASKPSLAGMISNARAASERGKDDQSFGHESPAHDPER